MCLGDTETYTANISNGTAPHGRQWFVDGVQVSTSSSFNYTPGSVGTYTISLITTDANGCIASNSINVSVVNCVTCDCSTNLVFDSGNCELDYIATGCTSWQLKYSISNDCSGSITVASGSGDVNSSYIIPPGDNGYYRLIGAENSCDSDQTACIDATGNCSCPNISVAINGDLTNSCENLTSTVTGGNSPYT